MSNATTTVENEQDLKRSDLIQQIRRESEFRTCQGEAQQLRQKLTDELKATTLAITKQILESNAIEQESARQLLAIDKAKIELLRSTQEGKQILALEAELKELTLVNGVPQLQLLKHQVELAMDQDMTEQAAILRGRITNLEGKIEKLKAEIERLWISFGFEMAWFLR